MSSPISSRARLSSLLVLLALLSAACGAQSAEPDGLAFADETTTTIDAGSGLVELKVAARNSIAVSPLWVAESRGFFEAAGLDVEFVPVADEANVPSALAEGFAPIGLLSSESVVADDSITDNLDVSPIVYINATDGEDAERGSWSLIVRNGSSIETGCDLVGGIVGVESATSVSAMAVREYVRRAGCDPSDIEFSEVVAASFEFAMRLGSVDAVAVTDPATAQLLRSANRILTNLDSELCGGVGRCPLSFAVARNDWLAANPDTATAFTEAMNAAMEWTSANDISYRAELLRCCAISADDAAEIYVPNFVGDGRSLDADIDRLREQFESLQLLLEAAEAANEEAAETTDEDVSG